MAVHLQALWATSLLIAAPVVYARWHSLHQLAHLELLGMAAAIGAVCALLFLLQSLMVYSPLRKPLKIAAGAFEQGQRDIACDVSRVGG